MGADASDDLAQIRFGLDAIELGRANERIEQRRPLAAGVLCLVVTTAQETTTFSVEPTEYGWSVSDGAERLGLFVSQRQALDDVKKRRVALKAKGRASSVEVTGEETEGTRGRYSFARR